MTRRIDQPTPGHWMVRYGRGKPEVPAAIMWLRTDFEPDEPLNPMDRSAFLAAFIDGEPVALHEVWERKGRAITAQEYAFQVADLVWAKQYAPDEAKANPRRAIDWLTVKI